MLSRPGRGVSGLMFRFPFPGYAESWRKSAPARTLRRRSAFCPEFSCRSGSAAPPSLITTRTCKGQPNARFATRLMNDASRAIGRSPKHSISDQGVQFTSKQFKKWLKSRGVKHRYGAVGWHGSISSLERTWRTLKESIPLTWCIFGTPESLDRHVAEVLRWYNTERPHWALKGAAPDGIRRGHRRRARALPATRKWKLTVIWTGPTCDLPVVRLRKVA